MKNEITGILECTFFLLLICIGFWNLHAILYPAVFTAVLLNVFNRYSKGSINGYDIVLLFCFLFESYSYGVSAYRPNSQFFYLKIITLVWLYYMARNIPVKQGMMYIVTVVTLYCLCINIAEVVLFAFHYFRIISYGFDDLTQFRNLFAPFARPSNEWVSVLFLTLAFPLALYTFCTGVFSKDAKSADNLFLIGKVRAPRWLKPVAVVAINLTIGNILLSFSRGAYLALFVLFWVYLAIICKCLPWGKAVKNILMLCIFSCVVAIMFHRPVASTLCVHSSVSHTRSIGGRIQLWQKGLDLFKKYPVNGIGTHNFALYGTSVSGNDREAAFSGNVSNLYLHVLVEKGIVGCVAYMSVALFLFFYARRVYKSVSLSAFHVSVLFGMGVAVLAFLIRELTFSSPFFSNSVLVLLLLFYVLLSNILLPDEKGLPLKTPVVIPLCVFCYLIFTICISRKYRECSKLYFRFEKEYSKGEYEIAAGIADSLVTCAPHNSYYLFCKALSTTRIYEKGSGDYQNWDSTTIPPAVIEECIAMYQRAIELNPYDGCFHHNLSWLYFYRKESSRAIYHINKAVQLNKAVGLYHISAGILYLKAGCTDAAFDELAQGTYLSPEWVGSVCWQTLTDAHPEAAPDILRRVFVKLETDGGSLYSLASAAGLNLYLKRYDMAKKQLEEVTASMPNWSRPWYYLGEVYQYTDEKKRMVDCYKKSLLNAPGYWMPSLGLGAYYEASGLVSKACRYYKTVLSYSKLAASDHAQQNKRIYHMEGLNNDILPGWMLSATKPTIDRLAICAKIDSLEHTGK